MLAFRGSQAPSASINGYNLLRSTKAVRSNRVIKCPGGPSNDQKSGIHDTESNTELYGLIIPKDNLLRRIMDLVDFTFVAEASGLFGMEIQGATARFSVNLKQILKLSDAKKGQQRPPSGVSTSKEPPLRPETG